ncbi:Clavesin-1 [Chamberlinius hualienensis]
MAKFKAMKLDILSNGGRRDFQGFWGSACKAFSNGTQGLASVLKKSTSAHSNLFTDLDNRRKKSNGLQTEKVAEEIPTCNSNDVNGLVNVDVEDRSCCLSEEEAERSLSDDFADDTRNKQEAIQAVRTLIDSKSDCADFRRKDDSFILRFLRARKFNTRAAYQLYCRYYEYRYNNKALFQNFHSKDPDINLALMDGLPGVLPIPDDYGHRILLIYAANWDHSRYGLVTVYRALMLTLEKLIEDEIVQLNGFVLIIDWNGFAFRHSAILQPRLLKTVIEGLQDCFPGRFYGVHFVNQPWYIEAALTVVKSFLKEKTKDRIFLHGSNLTTLHNHISKDVLPVELGGYCAPYNTRIWAEKMMRDEALASTQNSRSLYNEYNTSSKQKWTAVHSETFPMNLNRSYCIDRPMSDVDEEFFLS